LSRAFALVLVVAASGCWTMLGLSDKEYVLGSTSSSGSPPSGLVDVDQGGLHFSIDPTEVTNAAYAAWLAEKPDPTATKDPRCAWNTSFRPGALDPPCAAELDPTCDFDIDAEAAEHPNQPVHCVDWCDALSYCEAHGERLCAGESGAPIVIQGEPDFAVPSSEWYVACAGPMLQQYPYGPTLEPDACNDGFGGEGEITDVGTPTCVGGFPGLFDMVGNVDEWVDACYDMTADGNCVRAGGAYYTDGTSGNPLPACDGVTTFGRRCQNNTTGFRCCAD
jgi:formylglycine-generating enzyme required for sulfatase activity